MDVSCGLRLGLPGHSLYYRSNRVYNILKWNICVNFFGVNWQTNFLNMKFSLCERIDKYDVCIIRTTPPLRKFADNNFENWHCEICVMLAIDHIWNYCCIKTLNFAFCKQIIKLVHSEHLDVETSLSSSLSVCLCLASCAHGQRYITGCPEQVVEGRRSELSKY